MKRRFAVSLCPISPTKARECRSFLRGPKIRFVFLLPAQPGNSGGRAAGLNQGFFMVASTSRTFDGDSLFMGAFYCILPGTSNVLVTEAY